MLLDTVLGEINTCSETLVFGYRSLQADTVPQGKYDQIMLAYIYRQYDKKV